MYPKNVTLTKILMHMVLSVEVDILDRVFSALARSVSPEEIMNIQSTSEENDRIEELAQKNRDGTLSIKEAFEVNQYLLAEKYVRLAKAHAYLRIKGKAV